MRVRHIYVVDQGYAMATAESAKAALRSEWEPDACLYAENGYFWLRYADGTTNHLIAVRDELLVLIGETLVAEQKILRANPPALANTKVHIIGEPIIRKPVKRKALPKPTPPEDRRSEYLREKHIAGVTMQDAWKRRSA